MKALCFGSLNIDYTYKVPHFAAKGETLSAEGLELHSGGKGLNQAIAISKGGANAFMAGAIGEDGKFLLQELKDAGVDTGNVLVMSEERTGNAIIQKNEEGDNCIILYGGANKAISKEQIDRTLEDFQARDLILLQNEINDGRYVIEKARERGMKIALNPSPLNQGVLDMPLESVDIFILNEIEAAQLLGRDSEEGLDGETLMDLLAVKYPKAALLLTLGEKGSIFRRGNDTVRQAAYKVSAVDTTGAGDTYTGFFLAGILSGSTVKESMERAAKAAAISVTVEGAAASIPSLEQVISTVDMR